MGDPQHQMAAAIDSAKGVKHSSASAVAEKTESRGPQPCVQKSGHESIVLPSRVLLGKRHHGHRWSFLSKQTIKNKDQKRIQ